jgi:ABC-type molybdate transport system substrate-binding protein
MRIRCCVAALVGLLLPLMATQVRAADISVFSSTALRAVLNELGPQFEKATGNKLVLTIGPAAVMTSQINVILAFGIASTRGSERRV